MILWKINLSHIYYFSITFWWKLLEKVISFLTISHRTHFSYSTYMRKNLNHSQKLNMNSFLWTQWKLCCNKIKWLSTFSVPVFINFNIFPYIIKKQYYVLLFLLYCLFVSLKLVTKWKYLFDLMGKNWLCLT